MNEIDRRQLFDSQPPRGSWLQRVLLITLGAGLVIAAVFFLTLALIAGAFLALAIGVRWWWLLRRLRAQSKASEALEGEYQVVQAPRVETRTHER